jgi:hypothetical protein
MADRCDGCGREIQVAGGIANFWTMDHTETGGIYLEFSDGEERLVCFECLEALPENATAADVDSLDRNGTD